MLRYSLVYEHGELRVRGDLCEDWLSVWAEGWGAREKVDGLGDDDGECDVVATPVRKLSL